MEFAKGTLICLAVLSFGIVCVYMFLQLPRESFKEKDQGLSSATSCSLPDDSFPPPQSTLLDRIAAAIGIPAIFATWMLLGGGLYVLLS